MSSPSYPPPIAVRVSSGHPVSFSVSHFFVADYAALAVLVLHVGKIIAIEFDGGIGAIGIAKTKAFAFLQVEIRPHPGRVGNGEAFGVALSSMARLYCSIATGQRSIFQDCEFTMHEC